MQKKKCKDKGMETLEMLFISYKWIHRWNLMLVEATKKLWKDEEGLWFWFNVNK